MMMVIWMVISMAISASSSTLINWKRNYVYEHVLYAVGLNLHHKTLHFLLANGLTQQMDLYQPLNLVEDQDRTALDFQLTIVSKQPPSSSPARYPVLQIHNLDHFEMTSWADTLSIKSCVRKRSKFGIVCTSLVEALLCVCVCVCSL